MTLDELDAIIALNHGATPEGTLSDSTLRYMHAVLSANPPRRSVETGCGRSTALLSRISRRHTVFCADLSGNRSGVAHASDSAIEWIIGPTQKTLPQYQFDEAIDCALIDGPHGYPFPDLEYFYIYPHLAPGAWLIVDDVQIPTIHNLYSFLRADRMFEFVKRSGDTAFFRRTTAETFDPYGDNWWTQQYNIENLYRLKPLTVRMKIRVRQLLRLAGRA